MRIASSTWSRRGLSQWQCTKRCTEPDSLWPIPTPLYAPANYFRNVVCASAEISAQVENCPLVSARVRKSRREEPALGTEGSCATCVSQGSGGHGFRVRCCPCRMSDRPLEKQRRCAVGGLSSVLFECERSDVAVDGECLRPCRRSACSVAPENQVAGRTASRRCHRTRMWPVPYKRRRFKEMRRHQRGSSDVTAVVNEKGRTRAAAPPT
jgi:hypothetical protein